MFKFSWIYLGVLILKRHSTSFLITPRTCVRGNEINILHTGGHIL